MLRLIYSSAFFRCFMRSEIIFLFLKIDFVSEIAVNTIFISLGAQSGMLSPYQVVFNYTYPTTDALCIARHLTRMIDSRLILLNDYMKEDVIPKVIVRKPTVPSITGLQALTLIQYQNSVSNDCFHLCRFICVDNYWGNVWHIQR